jgi:hypothetical protein
MTANPLSTLCLLHSRDTRLPPSAVANRRGTWPSHGIAAGVDAMLCEPATELGDAPRR